jgi:pimeloyl-ACP methyl ester carboxylesterase
MESIRAALGVSQINYYGASYRTYLGSVYATLFQSHVRRMVLDSNVRPSGVWYDDNLDQDRAFDRNINNFFAWVAQYDSVYHVGATASSVRRFYYDLRRRGHGSPRYSAGGDAGARPGPWEAPPGPAGAGLIRRPTLYMAVVLLAAWSG